VDGLGLVDVAVAEVVVPEGELGHIDGDGRWGAVDDDVAVEDVGDKILREPPLQERAEGDVEAIEGRVVVDSHHTMGKHRPEDREGALGNVAAPA